MNPHKLNFILVEIIVKSILLGIFTFFISPVQYAFSGNTDIDIRRQYFRDRTTDSALNISTKIKFFDSLISVTPDREAVSYRFEQSVLLFKLADFEKVVSNMNRVLDSLDKDSLNLIIRAENNLAVSLYNMNRNREAMAHAYKILSIPKPVSLKYYDIDQFRLLSHIYSRAQVYTKADSCLKCAMQIFEELKKKSVSSDRLKEIQAALAYSKSAYLISIDSVDEGFQTIVSARNIRFKSVSFDDNSLTLALGVVCMKRGQYDAAESYFKEVISTGKCNVVSVSALTSLCDIMLATGRPHEAAKILEEHEDVLNMFSSGLPEILIGKTRFEVAKALGNMENSMILFDKLESILDSTLSSQEKYLTEDAVLAYESIEDSKKLSIELKRIKVKNVAGIVCGLLLIGVSGIAIFLYKENKRRRLENENLQKNIESVEERYNEEIDRQRRELTTKAVKIAHLNDTLNSIGNETSNYRVSAKENVVNIKRMIRNAGLNEDDWNAFSLAFESVNQKFFDKLYYIQPSLSNSEVRMCAFILMNMTTNQIAKMTNRSPRTVETIKYNLRKKLRIEGSSEAYMREVSLAGETEINQLKARCSSPSSSC